MSHQLVQACQLSVVHEGKSALSAAGGFLPDVAFLDIGRPDMSGHEVAAALRLEPQYKDLVLIALTGWGSEEDHSRSKQAGFDLHLTKPVDAQTLSTALDIELRRAEIMADICLFPIIAATAGIRIHSHGWAFEIQHRLSGLRLIAKHGSIGIIEAFSFHWRGHCICGHCINRRKTESHLQNLTRR